MRHGAVIGVDVGGTRTKGGVVDRSGRMLVRADRPTDDQAGTKGILAVVEELLAHPGIAGVDAVGVGAAGFVQAETGSVTFSPNLVYDDPHIAEAVRARSGLPTVVDNDANAAAYGERAFGAARADHVAYVTIGTGVGSGFIVEGRIVRGLTGAGAEAGHMVIDPAGPPCGCGLRGCLEQFASGTAIARMAKAAAKEDPDTSMIALAGSVDAITAEDVAGAAGRLDEAACGVLRRAGRSLGVGLSNLVNIFDPEVIVLGGGVIKAGEPYLGPARDELARMTAAQRRRPIRLDVTRLGGDAGILGAAALALDAIGGAGDGAGRGRKE